ncbi:MAG: kelch repeat-containing protein [Kangiellaceae bacterium]|nr:kelch repeat-containing protein [Kangiellaceae bacterium]
MAGALKDDTFYIFGGRGSDDRARNNMFCVELGNHRFKQIPYTYAPKERDGHTLVAWDEYLILFGGIQGSFGSYNYYNDTHVFDLEDRFWVEIECHKDLPDGREGHAAWVIGDSMYVYGGLGQNGVISTISRLDIK